MSLTAKQIAKLNKMCPAAKEAALGTAIKDLEEATLLELASLAEVATGTDTTKGVTPAGVAQEAAKLKVKQTKVNGVTAGGTISFTAIATSVNEIAGVLAFTKVTAGGTYKGLLGTADLTIGSAALTCVTDQSANDLIVTFR